MSERREKVKTIHKKDSITYTGNPKNSPVSCVRENKEKHSPSEIFHDIYRKSSPVSCVRENKEKHSPSEIFHEIYRKSSPVSCASEERRMKNSMVSPPLYLHLKNKKKPFLYNNIFSVG